MTLGKFDGVLIASDFDDTLCPPSGIIPAANLDAIAYFQSEGGLFTVATGRAHTTFAPQLSQTPVNAPVVLSNGAQIYDFATEKYLVDSVLPDTAQADALLLAELFPTIGMEAYHGEDIYLFRPNPWTDYHKNKVGFQGRECPIEEMPQPWGKLLLLQAEEKLLPVREYILTHWGDRYEAIFSNGHLLEVTRKGCNKGAMVQLLAQKLGIRREDLYCVGDNQNDLPMLSISAVPFAPANCAQSVREHPGVHLLRSCEEGCVAELVAWLDGRK